ncbi:hypothetical protein C8F04DRAFT_701521 [Mycena alexandri]|uniref:Uncharacterized protein n=1 Tax=Mycena alexandri TaxID=1745969 RepID=A0AAD6X0J2_9AGAR|nr:hypothetical protein C8F04DRAFT_701521 [Mycena alexandri]
MDRMTAGSHRARVNQDCGDIPPRTRKREDGGGIQPRTRKGEDGGGIHPHARKQGDDGGIQPRAHKRGMAARSHRAGVKRWRWDPAADGQTRYGGGIPLRTRNGSGICPRTRKREDGGDIRPPAPRGKLAVGPNRVRSNKGRRRDPTAHVQTRDGGVQPREKRVVRSNCRVIGRDSRTINVCSAKNLRGAADSTGGRIAIAGLLTDRLKMAVEKRLQSDMSALARSH